MKIPKPINILLLLMLLLLIQPALAQRPKQFKKNDHVSYETKSEEGQIIVKYRFMDPWLNMHEWTLQFPEQATLEMIGRFGIPRSMFDRYLDTEENRRRREAILKQGLFKKEDNTLMVDKNAVVAYYAPHFCKPVAELIAESLAGQGKDNRMNRIRFAMRFVQDIPYGIPKSNSKDMHYGGIQTPPEILIEMYGDCDSKALLFAGVLSYLVEQEDIVFLNQPEHVLTAIKHEPENGDTYVKYKGEKFVIAETAGPARRDLGERGDYFNRRNTVEPLDIPPAKTIPYAEGQTAETENLAATPDEEGKFLFKNISNRTFRFQLSVDQENWKTFHISPGELVSISLGNKKSAYLRIRKSAGFENYSIHVGEQYVADYKPFSNKWKILVKD